MKEVHYFQRYHKGEDMHTGNAMLLLNRLYNYRPQYLYKLLGMLIGDVEIFKFGLAIGMQERNGSTGNSVPDAIISQNGFRICIETKIGDWFHIDQMQGHINTFKEVNDEYKILFSLSNTDTCKIHTKIDENVKIFNREKELEGSSRLFYKHITFEQIIDYIEQIILDRDYEFKDILEDYSNYCYENNLIDNSYKLLRIRAASETFDKNMEYNLYYDSTDRGFTKHAYLGLYRDKAVRLIGKVKKIVSAKLTDGNLTIDNDVEVSSDERKRIYEAILDGKSHDYNLVDVLHNYFIVEKFVETNYIKNSKGGLFGSRQINLESECGIKNVKLQSIEDIALQLNNRVWS